MTVWHECGRNSLVSLLLFCGLLVPIRGGAQDILTTAERVISVQRGSSAIITVPDTLLRVLVADPAVAEAVVIPPRQLVVNAIRHGIETPDRRKKAGKASTGLIAVDITMLEGQVQVTVSDAGGLSGLQNIAVSVTNGRALAG